MRKLFCLLLVLCYVCNSNAQIGGSSSFEFLSLRTSPKTIALGGYLTAAIDSDLNNGIYNPSLINSKMDSKMTLNYINYYSDISYGDVGYCFSVREKSFISSMKFIDYGTFIETNELGHEIGSFGSGEYVFSLGTSHFMLDSMWCVGVNAKFAYSSLYELNSTAFLFDFAVTYNYPTKDIVTSLIVKNLGYQINTYHQDIHDPLPFEISLGISNRLEHMPLRWHLTFQHLETPNLFFQNPNSSVTTENNNFGYDVLRHIVFGSELFIHKNVSILAGYNNRKRFEMVIQERRGLVGFSCGFSLKINRFQFYYSRASNHYSGAINSFGIATNFNKND